MYPSEKMLKVALITGPLGRACLPFGKKWLVSPSGMLAEVCSLPLIFGKTCFQNPVMHGPCVVQTCRGGVIAYDARYEVASNTSYETNLTYPLTGVN